MNIFTSERAMVARNKYQTDVTLINKFPLMENDMSMELKFNLIFMIIQMKGSRKNTNIYRNIYDKDQKQHHYIQNKRKIYFQTENKQHVPRVKFLCAHIDNILIMTKSDW